MTPGRAGAYYLRATGMVMALRLLLPWARLPRILGWITPPRLGPPCPAGELSGLIRYLRILCRLGWPTRGTCLPLSLAVFHAACRLGVPVTWHCGVRPEGSELAGHAWLTLHGEPFLNCPDTRRPFAQVLFLPAPPAPEPPS